MLFFLFWSRRISISFYCSFSWNFYFVILFKTKFSFRSNEYQNFKRTIYFVHLHICGVANVYQVLKICGNLKHFLTHLNIKVSYFFKRESHLTNLQIKEWKKTESFFFKKNLFSNMYILRLNFISKSVLNSWI